MARKTVVALVDDLTGEAAENISTVEFALDGMS
jgi:Lsr2